MLTAALASRIARAFTSGLRVTAPDTVAALPTRQNVVQLHPAAQGSATPAALQREAPTGLLDEPVLAAVLQRDYFAAGYAEGAASPNHEALEHGGVRVRMHLTSAIGEVCSLRVAQIDQARLGLLDAGPLGSPLAQERLNVYIATRERDLQVLNQQVALAVEGLGWLQPRLVDYRAGFQRALREALDLHLGLNR